jgi:hypothetical protein
LCHLALIGKTNSALWVLHTRWQGSCSSHPTSKPSESDNECHYSVSNAPTCIMHGSRLHSDERTCKVVGVSARQRRLTMCQVVILFCRLAMLIKTSIRNRTQPSHHKLHNSRHSSTTSAWQRRRWTGRGPRTPQSAAEAHRERPCRLR